MFTSIGLFKDITCPLGVDCLLVNCLFNHQARSNQANDHTSNALREPSAVSERLSPPPPKRRRLEEIVKPEPSSLRPQRALAVTDHLAKEPAEKSLAPGTPAWTSHVKSEPLGHPATKKSKQHSQSSASARKSVSPPPVRRVTSTPPVEIRESLNPRTIPHAPAQHAQRKARLTALHAAMAKLNDDAANKPAVLSSNKLILMANAEEERIALASRDEDSYRTLLGQQVMKYRKMKLEEWKGLVLEHLKGVQVKQATTKNEDVNQPPTKTEGRHSGGLDEADKVEPAFSTILKPEQEIALLPHIRTDVDDLVDYVTTPPSKIEVANARKGLDASVGQEVCDRCRTRFTVFPGRDEQGKLTSGGQCQYHWAKLPKFAADARYECCGSGAGSRPCTTAQSHVFKVTDPKRLAAILQFEETPERENDLAARAVSIDCEMGYTTMGMEMIRLSALSWPQCEDLIDVLVRPIGEVLDLNTRFSGVSLDQFNKARPFGTNLEESNDSTSEDGEVDSELMKVESPVAARQLLFDKIDRDTALIGHAIDNDLNVLRIIHPFIVDTVLLYPHPRGLPIRYGLKMLTNKYLHRNIQDRHTGHDSKEDARATGELVRLKVDEKWKKMRNNGWEFDNGRLVPTKEGGSTMKPKRPPKI